MWRVRFASLRILISAFLVFMGGCFRVPPEPSDIHLGRKQLRRVGFHCFRIPTLDGCKIPSRQEMKPSWLASCDRCFPRTLPQKPATVTEQSGNLAIQDASNYSVSWYLRRGNLVIPRCSYNHQMSSQAFRNLESFGPPGDTNNGLNLNRGLKVVQDLVHPQYESHQKKV